MKIKLTIDTDNAAFADNAGEEVQYILEQLAQQVNPWDGDSIFSIIARDSNGNKVGSLHAFHVDPSPEPDDDDGRLQFNRA